ncbi:MAG: hypothetical protein GTN78_10220, partial [Gemmatimonadales bacterium]|nr:hypothetical protein [Gemmatimonadales bacterium]
PMVIALAVGSALSGLAVARASGVFSCLAGSAASGLFMSGIFALVMTDAARRFPQRTGAAFGLVVAGVGVGALVIPAAMGLVAGVSDLRTAMLIPSALMLMVAGIYLRLGRR